MMKTRMNNSVRASLMFLLVFLMAAAGALGNVPLAQAASAPATTAARQAASLPADTCTLIGPGLRECQLFAKEGTISLPDGAIVPVWGFAASAADPASVPGPAIIVNEGETVRIVFENQIPGETISLSIPGQDMVPDTVGVATTMTTTYEIVASRPGTNLYEAGLTVNGPRQVAMGLFGAIIVRPASNPAWAYDAAGTAFTDEALLVFSEIDPAFNANPATFDITKFKPKYWLLNGQSYSDTTPISVSQGSQVLMRYVNAGLQEHSIGLLGRHQSIIGEDNSLLPFPRSAVAKTMGAGQAMDALVTIPMTVTVGTRYPVYNTSFQQDHNAGELSGGAVGYGGILTFLDVAGGIPVADTGPLASNVTVAPNPANTTTEVTFSATLDETATGGENVVAAEFYTNTVGIPGSGVALAVNTAAVTVNVSTTFPAGSMVSWEAGDVTFYVRGQDADGTWGPVSSTVLDLVGTGPIVRGIVVNPSPTNGSRPVALRATADDTQTGGVNVMAGEYFIDTTGADGTGNSMALNMLAPIVELSTTIPQVVVDALPEGEHFVYVHGQDTLGNWGAYTVASLWIDKSGPPSVGTSLLPNPNNGRLSLNASSNSIRLMVEGGALAEISNVERIEGFIDNIGTNGTGFPLVAYDALYNNFVEIAYVDIPLSTVQLLTEGPHSLFFHSRDTAGNWGAFSSMTLIMDKTGPVSTSFIASPNPTNTVHSIQLTAVLQDAASTNVNGTAPGSNITRAEYFVGAIDPGPGSATPMTAQDGTFDSNSETAVAFLNITGWANGNYQVRVRAMDAAGNWGAVTSLTLSVTNNFFGPILVDGFDAGHLNAWTANVGNVSVSPDANMDDGGMGLRVGLDGAAKAYLTDASPDAKKAYVAGFLFNPHWSFGENTDEAIFVGKDIAGGSIFGIQYRDGYSGQTSAVRAWVLVNGSPVYTEWHAIPTNAASSIGLSWSADTAGSLVFFVNGAAVQTVNNVDTSAYALEEVQLGAVDGLTDQSYGSMYFDGFVSGEPSSQPQLDFRLFMPSITK